MRDESSVDIRDEILLLMVALCVVVVFGLVVIVILYLGGFL